MAQILRVITYHCFKKIDNKKTHLEYRSMENHRELSTRCDVIDFVDN